MAPTHQGLKFLGGWIHSSKELGQELPLVVEETSPCTGNPLLIRALSHRSTKRVPGLPFQPVVEQKHADVLSGGNGH